MRLTLTYHYSFNIIWLTFSFLLCLFLWFLFLTLMFILCYYCLWVWLVLMSLLARRGNVSFYCKKERKMKKDKCWTSKTSPSDTITCTHTFHLSIVDPASISAWTPSAQKITTKTIITCHKKETCHPHQNYIPRI